MISKMQIPVACALVVTAAISPPARADDTKVVPPSAQQENSHPPDAPVAQVLKGPVGGAEGDRSPFDTDIAQADAASLRRPTRQAYLNAIQTYAFAEGARYYLATAPERVSDVALQPGESVIAVASGDTARWTIGDTSSGAGPTRRSHILVKPQASGLGTNLVITTDRRVYHLELDSRTQQSMAGIAWTYPKDGLLAVAVEQERPVAAADVSPALDIARLRFDYRITGDKVAWRPLRAFDDGRQTFIEFPASMLVDEAPPLFVLDAKASPQLVNYRVSGRWYIVDRLFDFAELRIGQKPQRVVRIVRTGHEVRGKGGR
ncbi:type IV secretion system protein VirB9 [Sphingomonas zeicaulis]|uniref:P-type conjugative transfer protein TrbG n=1 Tax=Sphingomonas zeicaulis TaxID=1632740 RepID=UPI003D20098F